jgi:tetratricopeptide (TPR) repeat protein
MRFVYLLLLLILNLSCSQMNAVKREIVIDSSVKEAEVSFLTSTGQFKVLGMTPITIEHAVINEWQKDNEYVVIKVSKSGYIVENLFIDLSTRHKVNYFAKLNAIDMWNNKNKEISSTSANALAIKVQKINQQVFNKNLDSALASTENLIEQFPKAHVFYDIKGSILFLMGRKDESIGSYEKSLSLNPENNEAKQMLEKVKRVQ